MKSASPEESFKRLDDLGNAHIEILRKIAKLVQEARSKHTDDNLQKCIAEYDEAVDRYIPILMAQAKIYWDLENYAMVEKIFRKSVEFCNDNDVWKLNVAHVLFMQEDKYNEAISFYEPLVKKKMNNVLDITAIQLANLCVSYIMTSRNEEAENLMRAIEKEEEKIAIEESDKETYHLCIVNLVIGTLYCSKGNYEFGISRAMKSLEPFNKKLGPDTWFYAKRCFAALYETLAKHLILLKDTVFQDILDFLDNCSAYGKNIQSKRI
jgi:tetratricopeptide repeat protein 30